MLKGFTHSSNFITCVLVKYVLLAGHNSSYVFVLSCMVMLLYLIVVIFIITVVLVIIMSTLSF